MDRYIQIKKSEEPIKLKFRKRQIRHIEDGQLGSLLAKMVDHQCSSKYITAIRNKSKPVNTQEKIKETVVDYLRGVHKCRGNNNELLGYLEDLSLLAITSQQREMQDAPINIGEVGNTIQLSGNNKDKWDWHRNIQAAQ